MTSSRDKSIRALVTGCRKGDKRDWAELIDRISPAIFSVCYRFRLAREESFDVFGKVSLLVLENLDRLRDESRIFGYVSTIAYHEAAAMKSRSKLIVKAEQEHAQHQSDLDWNKMAQEMIELDQELKNLSDAFYELPARCQELLRLLFFESESISYRDISRRMKIPVSSVGPTRMRCLKKLREIMKQKGGRNEKDVTKSKNRKANPTDEK